MASETEVDDFLEHFGVKGMKWGVRRNSKTGVRPIAKSLDESKFGKLAKANADRHDRRSANRKINQKVNQKLNQKLNQKDINNSMSLGIKERKRLISEGSLSLKDARKGSLRFGRNVTAGLLAGAAGGVLVSKLLLR